MVRATKNLRAPTEADELSDALPRQVHASSWGVTAVLPASSRSNGVVLHRCIAGPGGGALGFEAGRGGRLSRTSLASSQIDRCGPGVVADPGSSLTLPCALIVSSLGEGLDFFNSAGFPPIHTCDSLLHRGSHVIQLWLNEGPCLVHSIMHRLYLLSQLRQSWLTSANAIPA